MTEGEKESIKEPSDNLELEGEASPSDNPEKGEACAANEYKFSSRYEAVLFSVYKNDTLSHIFKIASVAIVFLVGYFFLFLLLTEFSRLGIWQAVRIAAIAAIPFLLVSLARRIINAPRPYELYSFYELPPKNKRGSAFPSRHVFSAFLIGSLYCFYSPAIGAVLLALGALLALMRVLLGIHFIRDTVAGALLGAVSGVVGELISVAIFV